MLEKNSQAMVNEKDLALILGLSVKTLQLWRYRKIGPPYIKLETRVRYRLIDVEEWLEARIRGGPE